MKTQAAKPAPRQARASTVDSDEVARFAARADSWWDPDGAFRPLHRLNPVRIRYIRDRAAAWFGRDPKSFAPFAGLRVLDVGCGGGLLAEPMARLGARVSAIDAAEESIRIAAQHAARSGLEIDYRRTSAEAFAAAGEGFDLVLAMEVVEHVADAGVFLAAAGSLVRPGGAMVAATLNRTLKSYALAIVGAEYVLGWLPPGSHRWERFLRPSELSRGLRGAGIEVRDIAGVVYHPLAGEWRLGRDTAVNYMAFAVKEPL